LSEVVQRHFTLFMASIEDEIKQSKFRDNYQKVAVNLLFTAGWLQGKQQEFFKSYGITVQQFNILRILRGQQPKRISGVEIKARMLDRNSDISRLLDRLLKKSLIEKHLRPGDKRATDIAITDNGLSLLGEIDKELGARERTMIGLSEAEAAQLSDLLDKTRG
jgi:DNA-binding MarR family transcriptional regulator